MADGPILFSGPMVVALDADRKTQTRRLATSPLAKKKPGDRLWVRERTLVEAIVPMINSEGVLLRYDADGSGTSVITIPPRLKRGAIEVGKRLSMGCFREASRLTLIVEEVRLQRLQEITEADAIAEGIEDVTAQVAPRDPALRYWRRYRDGGWNGYVDSPIASYASLWTELHGPGSWEENPEIVALTFRVVRENIDRIAA